MNSDESKEEMTFSFIINWILDFGNFILENLDDCLQSQYSCHVACTLIGALAGDLVANKTLMSRNLKKHKKEFQSQFTGKFTLYFFKCSCYKEINLLFVIASFYVIVLILGLFGREQCPAALSGILHVPGGPFQRFICAWRPFMFASLRPSVCLSVSHLKGF